MAANAAIAIQERDREVRDEHMEIREIPTLGERIKNVLYNIFAGHEEFFGCTPD